jgi:enoyl-CoA hydratase/carnithine racemase
MTAEQDPASFVLVDVSSGVATVTLNRPERLNALTPAMRVQYIGALRRLDADPSVRVVVVTGAGRGFCSGADTGVLASGGESLTSFAADPANLPTMALGMKKPLVAAINGADVRFVAADAKISSTFARLGLVAEYGSGWLLPRIIGMGRAAEILLSGRTFDGREAVELGLAVEALDAGETLARAQKWATEVAASCAPWALSQMKQQLYMDAVLSVQEATTRSVDLMVESFSRPELAEALAARAAKRAPQFPSD